MKLTKEQFEKKLIDGNFVLTLIGMSNIGKTAWSKRLKKINFKHICCDDLIEEKLEPELIKHGYKGIAEVAKWLGFPHQENFAKNEQSYLDFEIQTMREISEKISKNPQNNTVIDTTGSVIYTGTETHQNLKEISLIVYIKAPEKMLKAMTENYFKRPKPVLWMDNFKANNNRSDEENLKISYPKLLDSRDKLYREIADFTIPYQSLRWNMSPEAFLETIKNLL